jgi:hypothetical protein
VAYPPYFPDGDAEARATVERLLHTKSGRGREYHFAWEQEANELVMSVLPALTTSIVAQRFVTVPGETVLGFTDDASLRRTVPVVAGDETLQEPPVIWRTGPRSTEPHLLVVGRPGAGSTTLVRSIALQALQHGEVVVVEGSGTGEFACFLERPGVLAVESALSGALAALEWASRETERRLIAANRARQAGSALPDDVSRPLWILLDRPSVFAHLAAAEGRRDPQELLAVPLRHGRAAGVTVVVADHVDALEWIDATVKAHTQARVVLGALTSELVECVLGTPPHTTPTPDVPPGRGYARLGASEVLRVQVPATPDPYDGTATEAGRSAVLALLPQRHDATEQVAEEHDTTEQDATEDDAAEEIAEETVRGKVLEASEDPVHGQGFADPAEDTVHGQVLAPEAHGAAGSAPSSATGSGSGAAGPGARAASAPVAARERAVSVVKPAAAPVAAEG